MPTESVKKIWPVAASHTDGSVIRDQSGLNMKLRPSIGPTMRPVATPFTSSGCGSSVSTRITRMAAKTKRIGMPIFASRSIPAVRPLLTTQKLTAIVMKKKRNGTQKPCTVPFCRFTYDPKNDCIPAWSSPWVAPVSENQVHASVHDSM